MRHVGRSIRIMIFNGDSSYRTQNILSMTPVLGKVFFNTPKGKEFRAFATTIVVQCEIVPFPMKKWNKKILTTRGHQTDSEPWVTRLPFHSASLEAGQAVQKPQSKRGQSGCPRPLKMGMRRGKTYHMC